MYTDMKVTTLNPPNKSMVNEVKTL